MRRVLALSCCALYVAFGFMAGAAHVHDGGNSHAALPGLHLNHTHLGDATEHDRHGHHPPMTSAPDESPFEGHPVIHHDGDALYLNITAHRMLDVSQRMIPAMLEVRDTIEAPSFVPSRRDERSEPLRGPPKIVPYPPRAPPA